MSATIFSIKEDFTKQFAVAEGTISFRARTEDEACVEDYEDLLHIGEYPYFSTLHKSEEKEVISMTSSFPLLNSIAELASQFILEHGSQVAAHIFNEKVRLLVSFPELVHNTLGEHQQKGHFNSNLYWERLCDSVLIFLFTIPRAEADASGSEQQFNFTSVQIESVLTAVISCTIKRGLCAVLLKRLSLLDASFFSTKTFKNQIRILFASVLEGCLYERKFTTRKSATVTGSISASWGKWVMGVLELAVKKRSLKAILITIFSDLVNDGDASHSKKEEQSKREKLLSHFLLNDLFYAKTTGTTTPRVVLRIIFDNILPLIERGKISDCSDGKKSTAIFDAIFAKWGSREIVRSSDIGVNVTIFNSVMYSLVYIKQSRPDIKSLPPTWLTALLNGVSMRMETTRSEILRNNGMTVAAAFAAFFVNSGEGAETLLKGDNFASLLDEWLRQETTENTSFSAQQSDKKATPSYGEKAVLIRREVTMVDKYPLDPDEEYTFFVWNENDATNGENAPAVHLQITDEGETLGDSSDLPSFGLQKVEKDEVDDHISVLQTFRECYNSFMGIGRGPNAQQNEIQHAIESGLLGLSKCLDRINKKIATTELSILGAEIGPMVSTLIPTLVSLTIYAPAEKMTELLKLRTACLVGLTVVCPRVVLFQFSSMVYNSSYAMHQRIEIIKAIGEAAEAMGEVEITQKETNPQTTQSFAQKRIYPPIPTANVSKRVAIAIDEGTATRRWGNAVAGRSTRVPKRYVNLLSQHAPAFIAVFLEKLDADHYKFFQDFDPYTPGEIIRSLIKIFRCLANVRHLVPDLCEQNFEFFAAVALKHPHDGVKKQAWVAIGEIMRIWCGAGPLLTYRSDGTVEINPMPRKHQSLMFTENWLTTLEVLQVSCEQLVKKNDMSVNVALLTVTSLRDLVFEKQDLTSMESNFDGYIQPLVL